MRTIGDYLNRNRASFVDDLSDLLEGIKAIGGELSQEELLKFCFELASRSSDNYNLGFDECRKLIEDVDSNFLNRKLPPHIKYAKE